LQRSHSTAPEQGAFFEGKSSRAEDPLAGTREFEVRKEISMKPVVNGNGEIAQRTPATR